MEIRRAEEKDIDDILSLRFRNYDEVMPRLHSRASLQKFRALYSPESVMRELRNKRVYVVEDAGRIVATGAFADFNLGTSETPRYGVSNFYVLPELHGRGIGRYLMARLFADAREHGASTFHVPSSRTGFGFYEKMGFIADAEQPDAADELTWMHMELGGNAE